MPPIHYRDCLQGAIARINGKKQQQLGFTLSNNNGDYHKIVEIQG
jgi:hypothetical protein